MAIRQAHEKILFAFFFFSHPIEIIRQVGKFFLDEVQIYFGHLPKLACLSMWNVCKHVQMCMCM